MVYIFLKGVLSFAACLFSVIRKICTAFVLGAWCTQKGNFRKKKKFCVLILTGLSSSSSSLCFGCRSGAALDAGGWSDVDVAKQTIFAFFRGERSKTLRRRTTNKSFMRLFRFLPNWLLTFSVIVLIDLQIEPTEMISRIELFMHIYILNGYTFNEHAMLASPLSMWSHSCQWANGIIKRR